MHNKGEMVTEAPLYSTEQLIRQHRTRQFVTDPAAREDEDDEDHNELQPEATVDTSNAGRMSRGRQRKRPFPQFSKQFSKDTT